MVPGSQAGVDGAPVRVGTGDWMVVKRYGEATCGPVRRERVALAAVQGGNLRREVAVIAILTALAGLTLAVLKLATDVGR